MKRKIKLLMSVSLIVVSGMIAQACANSSSEETECSSTDTEYQKGFEEGKNSPYDTVDEWKREINNGAGLIGEVSQCWEQGFIDAKNN